MCLPPLPQALSANPSSPWLKFGSCNRLQEQYAHPDRTSAENGRRHGRRRAREPDRPLSASGPPPPERHAGRVRAAAGGHRLRPMYRIVVFASVLVVALPSLAAAQGRECGGHFIDWIGGRPQAARPPGRQHNPPTTTPFPNGLTQYDRMLWDQLVLRRLRPLGRQSAEHL